MSKIQTNNIDKHLSYAQLISENLIERKTLRTLGEISHIHTTSSNISKILFN